MLDPTKSPPATAEIDAWLERNGHTRAWLAEQIGVHFSALWRWLMGQRQPRVEHVVAIEQITGVRASAWLCVPTLSPTGTEGR